MRGTHVHSGNLATSAPAPAGSWCFRAPRGASYSTLYRDKTQPLGRARRIKTGRE